MIGLQIEWFIYTRRNKLLVDKKILEKRFLEKKALDKRFPVKKILQKKIPGVENFLRRAYIA